MIKPSILATCSFLLAALSPIATAQTVGQLTAHNVKVEAVEYRGKPAVKVTEAGSPDNGEAYAILKDIRFHNGTIELDVAGQPAAGSGAGARGFIGTAFHLQNGRYEYIYLRPTNGRADDQVRRNHSVQYSSHPDFGYDVSRQVAPEKYESYADLEPGAWTHYRITVEGMKARLYVNGASQPCLVVNDMKMGDTTGGVALWVGPGTEGYFSGLKIEAK